MRPSTAASLALVALFGPGCVPVDNTRDFLEMHGSFQSSGHMIDEHLPATTGIVPSLSAAVGGKVTAVGAPANGPDNLRGFRIEWNPALVQAGTAYASSPSGPVLFYIIGPDADAGGGWTATASTVASGNVTFTQVSAASKSIVKGTVADITLDVNGTELLSISDGSFQATQP